MDAPTWRQYDGFNRGFDDLKMAIQFTCQHCRQQASVPDDQVRVTMPLTEGQVSLVPQEQQTPAEEGQAMSPGEAVEEWEASLPSETDDFLKEWGFESWKQQIPLLNQFLTTMITLNTALLGAGIIFQPFQAPPGQTVSLIGLLVSLVVFLASLLASLRGLLGYKGKPVCLLCPADIEEHKADTLRFKRRWLRWSVAAFVAGFGLALAGLAVKVYLGP